MSPEIEAIVLEDAMLNLDELARSCQVSREWVIAHIHCGLLPGNNPDHTDPTAWTFNSHSLIRVRRILTVERDFDCNPELAGLVADLIEEISILRSHLHVSR